MTFAHHLRHAVRRLVRERSFTFATVATLALGVGANVAVFAVTEAVLLRPLPYEQPDELVILRHKEVATGITKEFLAVGDYVDMEKESRSFQAVSAYGTTDVTIFGEGDPFRVNALLGSSQLFDVLRVRPLLGRGLEPGDSREGAGPVVVLGYELWRTRFNADSGIVGRSIQVGPLPRLVVGIASPGLRFPPNAATDVVVPLPLPAAAPEQRRGNWLMAVARLGPGVTVERATADLATLAKRFEADFPQSNRGITYYAVSLRDELVGDTSTALLLMIAAVGVVLLIACVNVANLLLVRSMGRRREMAVRTALGASRRHLAGQLLMENGVLALVSGVVGVAIAHFATRALITVVPETVSAPGLADVTINGYVLAFALAIVALTTIGFGMVASLSVRGDVSSGNALTTRGDTISTRAGRAATALVTGEVALAVMLLVGAGLVMRTFATVMAVDPGFRTDDIMTVNVALPADRYESAEARRGFYDRAFAGARALPGVREVGAAAVTPLTGNNWTQPFLRPEQPPRPGERAPEVGWQVASGGYFRAMGIPLRAGRLFDESDRLEGRRVVIISESVRKLHFAVGEDPIGKTVGQGDDASEIVGVVGDIRRAGLRDELRADMYLPFERTYGAQTTLFVRTSSDAVALLAPLQGALREIEPQIVFTESRTMSAVAEQSEGVTRLMLWLLGVFAVSALALAAVGIYGVMSHIVRQRTKEFGIRLALGATRGDILRQVMTYGVGIATVGTAAGLAIGLGSAHALRSVLYGISSSDPATLSIAALVLVATALFACYLPARRAIAVDPARTLVDE